jgi:hypothetical protein
MSSALLSPARGRVDREAGIIHRVKLCGVDSKKGRMYPRNVLTEAIDKYEGAPCFIDHAPQGQPRKLAEKFGVIRGVFQGADGALYGNLHYNRAHPMAPQILEAAENCPDTLGMSHNANGPTRLENGREVVTRIDRVLSCDLVHCPATANSLYESLCLDDCLPSFRCPSQAACVAFAQRLKQPNTTTVLSESRPTPAPTAPPPARPFGPISEQERLAFRRRLR